MAHKFHFARTSLCTSSTSVWSNVARKTPNKFHEYFNGLCLDCMKNHLNEDSEYWRKDARDSDDENDGSYRIFHGEPTWYFSFLGRQVRNRYGKNEKDEGRCISATD